MKPIAILSTLILITHLAGAQVPVKGDKVVRFSIGAGMSNLLNSEAPHKINIFGSDTRHSYIQTIDITRSSAYNDYQTGLFEDILAGVTMNAQLEYFLKEDLSVLTGISFESKGINLRHSAAPNIYTNETFNLKIRNNYLILPLLLQKYLTKEKNFYVTGGFYAGYLISSRIDYLYQKSIFYNEFNFSDTKLWIDDEKDKEREYTHHLDLGFSIGTGYVRQLSNKLSFKTQLLFNMGLRQVDRKYNNEYSITSIAGYSGYSLAIRSTNYYGLNSNTKNMNLLLTVGLGYHIGK